jgi:uncharacterized protein YjbJ (UPF0337 family)
MTKLEIKGDWNITKGVLKQKWAKLTDDDLQYVEGKQDELLGRIQKRTGESREAVEKAIKQANRVEVTGLRPSPLPHHRTCGSASGGSNQTTETGRKPSP